MAAKKKSAAPRAADGQRGGIATLSHDKDSSNKGSVEVLPKNRGRDTDGVVTLRGGMHEKLDVGIYRVHGSDIELSGNVFVADHDVNWIPIAKCTCKADRPDPIEIRRLANGKFAIIGTCNNKKCNLSGASYLWVVPATRFRL